jgi:hypothetical protein
VNIAGLVYGVSAIVILSGKTPPLGSGFFNTWIVPIMVGIIAALGALYLLILRPKENIGADDRA